MGPLGQIRVLHPYYKIEGVDVSKWQGMIDWNELIKHIDFVYIRAGDGMVYPDMKDTQFTINWQAARRLNIPHGAYWFFRTNKSTEEQADNFIKFMGGWYGNLPPVIDVEKNDGNLSPVDLASEINRFMALVQRRSGMETGIYTSWGFSGQIGPNVNMTPTKLLWVAQYNDFINEPRLPRGWTRWDLWQKEADNNGVYNTGLAMGVRSRAIDRNVWRGDANTFYARFQVRIKPRGGVNVEMQKPKYFTPRSTLQLRTEADRFSKARGQVYTANKFEVLDMDKDRDGQIWYRIGPGMWVAGWIGTPEF